MKLAWMKMESYYKVKNAFFLIKKCFAWTCLNSVFFFFFNPSNMIKCLVLKDAKIATPGMNFHKCKTMN